MKETSNWSQTEGEILHFTDFDIEFLGKKHNDVSPEFAHVDWHYEFRVFRNKDSVIVTWSTGTGLIGPRQFEFLGKRYTILPTDQVEIEHKS